MNHPTDHIETYLTGGLSPEENAAFETHLAGCPQCAALVAQARADDARMNELFYADRPSADFEDRMIQALAPTFTMSHPWLNRPIVHPLVRRVAVGIAASILLGSVGLVANFATDGGLRSPRSPWAMYQEAKGAHASSNLKNIGSAMTTYTRSFERGRIFDRNGMALPLSSDPAEIQVEQGTQARPAEQERKLSATTFGKQFDDWLTVPTKSSEHTFLASRYTGEGRRSGISTNGNVAWKEAGVVPADSVDSYLKLTSDGTVARSKAEFGEASGNLGYNPPAGGKPDANMYYAWAIPPSTATPSPDPNGRAAGDNLKDAEKKLAELSYGFAANSESEVAQRGEKNRGVALGDAGKTPVALSLDAPAVPPAADAAPAAAPATPAIVAATGLPAPAAVEGKTRLTGGREAEARFDARAFGDARYEKQDHPYAGQVIQQSEANTGKPALEVANGTAAGRDAHGGVPEAGKSVDALSLNAADLTDNIRPTDKPAQATHEPKEVALQGDPKTPPGTDAPVKVGESALEQAREAEAAGRLDEAREKFAEAVHANPTDAAAQAGLDQVLTQQGRNPSAPTALATQTESINIRKQDISYREDLAIKEAKQAIADHKWDLAQAAIQRSELAAGADRAVFNDADLHKMDADIDGTKLAMAQELERVKLDAEKNRQAASVRQLEEERARAAVERENTIRDLKRTADDLTKQGKTKEAEGVQAQIQQLEATKPVDPPKPATPDVAPVPDPKTTPPHAQPPAISKPKIIRTGEMEFEVDKFEMAVETITKVVEEEGGYVSTTNSDKLPNGKVKGSVVLRVSPDRLDTLVLKLRGIGDLKTQNIHAEDITKAYTDLESRLRAAQIMCDQLLEIIKGGKAQVKDLLEAEKQLGVYREKVEQLTGEINYYSNQISLSTLTLTLFERDIRTPAMASETETVNMTLVTEKVEDATAKAKEAITAAKGRIIASQLEQHDAGEFIASVSAQVPPDAADGVIARLRQIEGQVSHFDRQRSQTTSNGTAPVDPRTSDPIKVKREDVTINLTLFNLARLQPRRQTTMSLAAKDVDDAKASLEEQVRTAGGRVIDSRTEYPKPDQKQATISFDSPTEKADGLIASLKSLGETLQITTIENANAQGVTESKRGFSATIYDITAIQPHRLTTLTLIAADVEASQRTLIDQAKLAGGKVVDAKIEHPSPDTTSGGLTFNLPSEKAEAFLATLHGMGETRAVATIDNNGPNLTDSKRGIVILLRSLTMFHARETQQIDLATANVRDTFNDLRAIVHAQSGRMLTERLNEADVSNPIGQLEFELPRTAAPLIDQQMAKDGQIVTRVNDRSTDTDNTVDTKVYVRLVVNSAEQLPPRQSTDLNIEVSDVQKATDDLRAAALSAGGRQVDNPAISQNDNGYTTATLRLDVPLDKAQALVDQADAMGMRKGRQTAIDTHAPEGTLARARVTVTFTTPAALANADEGIWAGVRRGLGTSLRWLSISLTLIVIGLCVIIPWAAVLWGGWRGVKWMRRTPAPVIATPGPGAGA